MPSLRKNAAKDAGIQTKGARAEATGSSYRVILELADPAKAEEAKAAVQKKVEFGDTSVWSYTTSGDQLIWSITGAGQRSLSDNATTQAMNIIESRINALGISEAVPQTHGAQSSHQILLQMPVSRIPSASRTS